MIWKTFSLYEKNLTESSIKLGHSLKIMGFACSERVLYIYIYIYLSIYLPDAHVEQIFILMDVSQSIIGSALIQFQMVKRRQFQIKMCKISNLSVQPPFERSPNRAFVMQHMSY